MKFIANIASRLLDGVAQPQGYLCDLITDYLASGLTPPYREEEVDVRKLGSRWEITLRLNCRDAETVKDLIHEALVVHFDPNFNCDIEIEINDELE